MKQCAVAWRSTNETQTALQRECNMTHDWAAVVPPEKAEEEATEGVLAV